MTCKRRQCRIIIEKCDAHSPSDCIAMASRTVSTTRNRTAETPQLLHLIGSDTITLKQPISRPSNTDPNLHLKQKDHSSFDSELVSPAWYVQPPQKYQSLTILAQTTILSI